MKRLLLVCLSGLLTAPARALENPFFQPASAVTDRPNTWTQPQTQAMSSTISRVATINPGNADYGQGIAYDPRGFVFATYHPGVGTNGIRLYVYDVNTATAPRAVEAMSHAEFGTAVSPRDIAVRGDQAFVFCQADVSTNTLKLLDISTPSAVSLVSINASGLAGLPVGGPRQMQWRGNYLYLGWEIAQGSNTFRIVDVSDPTRPFVRGGANLTDLPASLNNFDVVDNVAYLTFENGTPNSFRTVDVRDPDAPRVISPTGAGIGSEPRGIAVKGKYAFTGSWFESTGVMVIDVSTPAVPTQVATLATPNPVISVYLAGDYLFVGMDNAVAQDDTFRIVDVSNPLNPFYVNAGTWTSGHSTDFYSITGNGKHLYLGGYTTADALTILQLNDWEVPVLRAAIVEAGQASVGGGLSVGGDLHVRSGVRVGEPGLAVAGPLAAAGNVTVGGVLSSSASFTVTIASGTGWDSLALPIFRAPDETSITITKVIAESLPASSTVQYRLEERAKGSVNSTGTNLFAVAESSATDNSTTETSFANAQIAANATIVFCTDTSAAAGTPGLVTLTVYYKKDTQ